MHLARASASASEARHSISLRRVSCPGLVHDRESAQDSRPYSHRSGQGERYRTAAGFPSMPQARPGPAGILMAAAPPAAIHRGLVRVSRLAGRCSSSLPAGHSRGPAAAASARPGSRRDARCMKYPGGWRTRSRHGDQIAADHDYTGSGIVVNGFAGQRWLCAGVGDAGAHQRPP